VHLKTHIKAGIHAIAVRLTHSVQQTPGIGEQPIKHYLSAVMSKSIKGGRTSQATNNDASTILLNHDVFHLIYPARNVQELQLEHPRLKNSTTINLIITITLQNEPDSGASSVLTP